MKKYLFIFLFLLFTFLPTKAVKKVDANPINVAILIVEKEDSTQISKLFDYYDYTFQGTTDGYKIMKNFSGNEIRYSSTDSNEGGKNTKVIVKTKATHKEIENTLTELKFKKIGNLYERMIHRYNNQVTQCNFGPSNSLVFHRFANKSTKEDIQ